MTSFPAGHLIVREFPMLTEAHVFASALASSQSEVRLIDVSMTSSGAWVCAWSPREISEPSQTSLKVDAEFVNALLSLGPKPSGSMTEVGIVEGHGVREVFESALAYASVGHVLLEVRVHRAGAARGAHAFFETNSSARTVEAALPLTRVPLVGDYRRFFL